MGLFSGLGIDAAAQNYLTSRAYAARTTLKQAEANMVSRLGGRFYDIDGRSSMVFAKVTQAVRRMSEETRTAMSLWRSISSVESDFDMSVDEVEVVYGKATLWMPISRIEKTGMLRETQPGRGVYLLIRPIGRSGDTPIFYIDYYSTVESMGLDRVLRDAVECATTYKDFTESLDIMEEAAQLWSHTADWNEEKHSAALSYIRGLAHWDIGEYELAKKYLEPAERFINSWPDDDVSSAMTAGLEAIDRVERK